jgi:hypothetical protein
MTTSLQLFSYKPKETSKEESIKWTCGNTKYECHLRTLESFDLQEMIPHCLQVLSKVNSAVAVENHKGPSYFKVFPRTLSIILEPVWNQLVEEARNNDDGGAAQKQRTISFYDSRNSLQFIQHHQTAMNG